MAAVAVLTSAAAAVVGAATVGLVPDVSVLSGALRASGPRAPTQAVGPKIAWVAEHDPEVAARARRLYMPASFLVQRLTGAYVLDHHSASQSVPLYDSVAQAWR